MERKIGEIFKYNGEWYQCVKSPDGSCKHCDMNFGGKCPIPIKECVASSRSDLSYVIFKKLEKVGEPYEFDGHLFQSYRTFEVTIFTENYATVRELGNNSKISIEIKQTKEDMEEKKLNLKPFDIQKAREGKPVCTRDGRKVRIVCFDRIDAKPILALIPSTDGKGEVVFDYFVSGKRIATPLESDLDLMMYPEKKEGWVNVYKGGLLDIKTYPTQKEALDKASSENYIATVKIEWEE